MKDERIADDVDERRAPWFMDRGSEHATDLMRPRGVMCHD